MNTNEAFRPKSDTSNVEVKSLVKNLTKIDFADAVGIATSDDVVSIALVRKRFNAVTVVDLESRALTVPAEGRWAVLTDFLREFIARSEVDAPRICAVLGRRDCLIGHMQLPAAAVDNLAQVVEFETDRVLPVAADAVYKDHYWRPMGTAGERISVTLIGGIKQRVDVLHDEFASAGSPPRSVVPLAVALSDYYQYCRGEDALTAGLFFKEGDREFVTVTSHGRMVSFRHFDASRESREERLRREIEALLPDIAEAPSEVVVDADESTSQPSLADIAPATLLPEGTEPTWLEAAAIGAALGEVGEGDTRVNLLPTELVKSDDGIGLREMALGGLVMLLAATLVGAIGVKNMSVQNALAGQLERLEPEVTAIAKREQENRELLRKIQVLEGQRARSVLAHLSDMTRRIPKTAYLTTFRFKGDKVEVDGIAADAAGLIAVLEESPRFKNVEFTAPVTKYLQDQERFSLRMEVEK